MSQFHEGLQLKAFGFGGLAKIIRACKHENNYIIIFLNIYIFFAMALIGHTHLFPFL